MCRQGELRGTCKETLAEKCIYVVEGRFGPFYMTWFIIVTFMEELNKTT